MGEFRPSCPDFVRTRDFHHSGFGGGRGCNLGFHQACHRYSSTAASSGLRLGFFNRSRAFGHFRGFCRFRGFSRFRRFCRFSCFRRFNRFRHFGRFRRFGRFGCCGAAFRLGHQIAKPHKRKFDMQSRIESRLVGRFAGCGYPQSFIKECRGTFGRLFHITALE